MTATTCDAVVIGAGIIGTAVAFELCKRGYRTLNVDRFATCGYGSTSSSSAIVRSHYSTTDGVAMAQDGLGYWRNWGDYLDTSIPSRLATFESTGSLVLMSRSGFHRKVLHNFESVGVPHEVWDAAELAAHCPSYDVREFWPPRDPEDPDFASEPGRELEGAVFTPGAGFVNDPPLATLNLRHAVEARGGRFRFKAQVVAVRRKNGRVHGVDLGDGERLDAPVVVNAAGPHSAAVNRMAGVLDDMNISTRAMRQEVHQVPAPDGFEGGHMTSDGDLGIYFRPAPGNQIIVGSEDPECDPRTWVADPDDVDGHVTNARWESQVYRLARRLPALRVPNRPLGVVGLYDVSDDWLPIYDRSSLDGFYLAIGTSGHQFKTAPVVGGLMAELIERVEAGHDHDDEPVTVPGRHLDVTHDAGAYSRRRQVNSQSSFAVTG